MYKFKTMNGEAQDKAFIDGYHFGSRLLEGDMFEVGFDLIGQITLKPTPSCADYFSGLQQKRLWLKAGIKLAEERLQVNDFGIVQDGKGGAIQSLVDNQGVQVQYKPTSKVKKNKIPS